MPSLARAYLITFRTHGTWLHGDGRLSAHQRQSNGYRSTALVPSPTWRDRSLSWMNREAVVFDVESRAIVNAAISGVCAHRGWHLFALNARTNHVHAVLSASCPPEEAMATFKAWSTRRLRETGHVPVDARVWARHGSTRRLWTEADVERAVGYVVEGQ